MLSSSSSVGGGGEGVLYIIRLGGQLLKGGQREELVCVYTEEGTAPVAGAHKNDQQRSVLWSSAHCSLSYNMIELN